jgi:hypothetical protein
MITLSSSSAVWKSQNLETPETLGACPGLYRGCFTYYPDTNDVLISKTLEQEYLFLYAT